LGSHNQSYVKFRSLGSHKQPYVKIRSVRITQSALCESILISTYKKSYSLQHVWDMHTNTADRWVEV